jgi:hypothetical protein
LNHSFIETDTKMLSGSSSSVKSTIYKINSNEVYDNNESNLINNKNENYDEDQTNLKIKIGNFRKTALSSNDE